MSCKFGYYVKSRRASIIDKIKTQTSNKVDKNLGYIIAFQKQKDAETIPHALFLIPSIYQYNIYIGLRA